MPKANEFKFTIKFNPYNSKHQEIIAILNNAGRRKAELIAKSIHLYMNSRKNTGTLIEQQPPSQPPKPEKPSPSLDVSNVIEGLAFFEG